MQSPAAQLEQLSPKQWTELGVGAEKSSTNGTRRHEWRRALGARPVLPVANGVRQKYLHEYAYEYTYGHGRALHSHTWLYRMMLAYDSRHRCYRKRPDVQIIGLAMAVDNEIGYGFKEEVYL